MSLILDALKKLDREKSARRNGTLNIATEILRGEQPRPGKRIPLYFVAIVLTAVATAAITYAVISKSSPPKAVKIPAQPQRIASVSPSQEPLRDARDDINRVTPQIQKPAESRKPAEGKKQPEARLSPAESEAFSESKGPTTPLEEKKTSQDVISQEPIVAPVITKKPAEQTPKVSSTSPPSLKLSAIVWYEEPSKRFAMINGVIASVGSVIDGAKVVEIQPTSVRFLYNDQHFEISISK